MTYAMLSLFALLLAAGQLLFKKAAITGADQAFPWAFANGWMLAALVLYGGATLLWTWLLRSTPLTVAYPFAALAFVLVPLLAAAVYGEALTARILLGAALIVAGIVVSAS